MVGAKKFTLYGLDNYKTIITEVLSEFKEHSICFDMELMLSEAITNAYIHGNKRDKSKPIYIMYKKSIDKVIIEIQDCGPGFEYIQIPDEISEERILDEHGRGLFLIKCVADNLQFHKNTLIITKKFTT